VTTHEDAARVPTFYDVAEVAVMLKMSRMTVYRAINSGELRAVRIRGRLLIPAAVIENLVAEATSDRVEDVSAVLSRFGGSPS
jgi:excisionase family DNA binding protein